MLNGRHTVLQHYTFVWGKTGKMAIALGMGELRVSLVLSFGRVLPGRFRVMRVWILSQGRGASRNTLWAAHLAGIGSGGAQGRGQGVGREKGAEGSRALSSSSTTL